MFCTQRLRLPTEQRWAKIFNCMYSFTKTPATAGATQLTLPGVFHTPIGAVTPTTGQVPPFHVVRANDVV